MKTYLTFIAIWIGLSCYGQEHKVRLESDNEVVEIFSLEGTKYLDEVLSFFDSWIQERTKIENIDKAYHVFCESLRECETPRDLIEKTKIDQKRLDSLVVQIEKKQNV